MSKKNNIAGVNNSALRRASLLAAVLIAFTAAGLGAQHLNIKNYTATEGLPQSQVRCIFQDSRGYLWLGTWSGAARYNGISYRNYDNKDGIGSNVVEAISEDSAGRILVGTQGGGLSIIDGDEVRAIGTNEGLPGDTVYDILSDPDGAIWLATDGGLACLREAEPVYLSTEHGLPDEPADAVHRDRNGVLWVGLPSGLYRQRGGSFVPVATGENFAGNEVNFITEAESGDIWYGSESAVYRIRGGRIERVLGDEYAAGIGYTCGEPNTEGGIWIGTGEGALRITTKGMEIFNKSNGLLPGIVNCIIHDRERNIWFATDNGASKLRHGPFVHYNSDNGLAHDSASVLMEDSRGRLWVGSSGGGLSVRENGGYRFRPADEINRALPSLFISGIAEGPSGEIFVSTSDGLAVWDGVRVTPLDHDVNASWIMTTPSGTILIATDEGAYELSGREMRLLLPEEHPLADVFVNCFALDKEGRTWIGTRSRGCIVWDGQSVISYGGEQGLTNVEIWVIKRGPDGSIWIGSNGDGAFRWDGKSFERFDRERGLTNDTVWQILADSNGNVWFGTNRGIDRYDGEKFEHFGIGEGLSDEEGYENASIEDSNGDLWFGFGFGLNRRYIPTAAMTADVPPIIHIERMLANGEPLDIGAPVELEYWQNSLVFEYAGLSFRNEAGVCYRYRLVGLDQEWQPVTSDHTIRYASIPPGEYTFEVVAISAAGIPSESPGSAPFKIGEPFYSSWWFRILIVGAALLVASAVIYLRFVKLKREKRILEERVAARTAELAEAMEELKAFTYSVSHDLRAPLNLIDGYCKALLEDEEGVRGEARAHLQKVIGGVSNMRVLIGELLDLSRASYKELNLQEVDVALMARIIASDLNRIDGGEEVDVSITQNLVVKADENLLKIALQNLLSNAWKFTSHNDLGDGRKVEMGIVATEKGRTFFVRDNGVGFDMGQYEKLFIPFQRLHSRSEFEGTGIGLATVKRVVNRHGGHIWAESGVGKGATFYFTLR